MNVYDFDGTLYRGNSTTDFFLRSLRRRPALLRFAPKQLAALCLFLLGRIDKTEAKQRFYCFLSALDAEAEVAQFWQTHEKKLFAWYPPLQRADDLVISASPEFLLRPICEKMGITALLASLVDPKTGQYSGKNCSGKEKVRRFREAYGDAAAEAFYSDSLHDTPMAELAENAYLIRDGKPVPWNVKKQV